MTFTADDARAYLDTRAGRAAQRECSACGKVDPPTCVIIMRDGERVTVHDECPATADGDLYLPTLRERSIPLLGADECRAACEAVIALTAQLAATEAEARTALDALHARCDAAEAEAHRLRVARLDDAARHAAERVRWGDRKVELLRRIVELEAALKAAQPALLLDAIRRGSAGPSTCARCGAPWGDAGDGDCLACGHPGHPAVASPDVPPEPDDPAGLFAAFDRMGVPPLGAIYAGIATGTRYEVVAAAPLAGTVYLRGAGEDDFVVPLHRLASDYRRVTPYPSRTAGGAATGNHDRAQLAALAGARFAEEHPAAAAGIVGACVAPKGEP